ncbi:DEAD/DEAH box helicase domain-containing protein [Jatrophihabitans sp. GAS493]|uniref:DEAD/DEAH box helicase n=1 Tax=Jatrophihabitans sp. GAS493 TaxID=1907575 RepID=UPI000BC0E661|nr:DEAD/DEAH box helicase domain-containing protein [Jatrophihabitans sp. GAS493]
MAIVPTLTAPELLRRLVSPATKDSLTHVETVPARAAETVGWPGWVPDELRERFIADGIAEPWLHQVEAAEAAHRGEHVVIATTTASGKSLAYQLPALTALLGDDRARVLYLSPTKALAGDQLRSLHELGISGVRAATYDGDTPMGERDWVRSHANWILTNPDMLHRGILAQHDRWASYLRRLRYVVIDECHSYRGVFGSHVCLIIRRLRRLCQRYGAAPVFILASATSRDPATSAGRLVGLPVTCVARDTAPHGQRLVALWEPPLTGLVGENGAPLRRSAGAQTSDLLASLVISGARTLAFVRSRRGAELTALGAQRALTEAGAGELAERVSGYRGGYLREERRSIEAALTAGELLGVAATNALELGLDISGLDAVLIAGFPGTLASFWQQAGRAGRSGRDALVVFVARDDPLDTYLVHHPSAVFGRPIESSVCDPANPYVLGPQLCCAAAEQPITEADLPLFGGEVARAVLADLVAAGQLRARPAGWFWTSRERPSADIRGSGGDPVSIVESSTGALLGTVDAGAAHSSVHPGAVYLHLGRSYLVEELDLAHSAALVHADNPYYSTNARDTTDIAIVSVEQSSRAGAVGTFFGTVDVTNQVVSFQRRRLDSSELIDETPLDLPPRQLRTRAVWYTIEANALRTLGESLDLAGAAHAAEHAAIGLLPLFATCDRWDIGGVSTALHPDTGEATIFVYDGHAGGAGFAERGYALLPDWLAATHAAVSACECRDGCPSCVQSPKCGNGNEPLDKAGAISLLGVVLEQLGALSSAGGQ